MFYLEDEKTLVLTNENKIDKKLEVIIVFTNL